MFDFVKKDDSIMGIINQLNDAANTMKKIPKRINNRVSFEPNDPQVFIEVFQQKESPRVPATQNFVKPNIIPPPPPSPAQSNIITKAPSPSNTDNNKHDYQKYNKVIKAMNEKTTELEKELVSYKKNIQETTAAFEDLKKKVKGLKEDNIMFSSQNKSMKETIESKESQNIALHVRITKLDEEVVSKDANVRTLHEQLDMLKQNIASLQQTNIDIKRMFSSKCEDFDALSRNYTVLEAQKTDNNVGLTILQGKYDELKELVSSKDNKIMELNLSIANVNRCMTDLGEKNSQITSDILKKHEDFVELESKYNVVSKNLAEKTDLISSMSDNSQQIQQQLQAAQSELHLFRDRYHELKIASDSKDAALLEVTSKLSVASYNLEDVTKRYASLEKNSDLLIAEMKMCRTDMESCQSNLESRTANYNSLLENYNKLEKNMLEKQGEHDVLLIKYNELKALLTSQNSA